VWEGGREWDERDLGVCASWSYIDRGRPPSATARSAFCWFWPSAFAAGAVRAQTAPQELPQSPNGTIRGAVTVLSQQGEPNPLEGIRVELSKGPQDLQPLATFTDSAGLYEFTQLAGGVYTLRVNQQGFKAFAENDFAWRESNVCGRHHARSRHGSGKGWKSRSRPQIFRRKLLPLLQPSTTRSWYTLPLAQQKSGTRCL